MLKLPKIFMPNAGNTVKPTTFVKTFASNFSKIENFPSKNPINTNPNNGRVEFNKLKYI